jgi:hypothetical protein
MANIRITIGAVNITNYLIAVAYKTTAPSVEVVREVYAPGDLNASLNVVLPSLGSIDADVYYVKWYESTDGTALSLLLGSSYYDARNNVTLSETRFYLTGGGRTVDGNVIDPEPGSTTLTDPYLNGKNITKVQKEAPGRPLVPPGGLTDSFKEYNINVDEIELLGGITFNDGEVIAVEITNVIGYVDNSSNAGLYDGTVLITASRALGASDRNKRLKCEADGSSIAITLESLGSVPDGKFYYFNCNGGSAKKVRIMRTGSDTIVYRGIVLTEISIGLGEHVRIEKYSSYWEVIDAHAGISQVGERVTKGLLDLVNYLPEDGRLVDGDVEPRLFKYVQDLPSTHKISDSTIESNSSWTHPAGKEGQFAIHPTLRKFRMPNSQGWYLRGLKDFDLYGTDTANRATDYPGGTQQGQVGPHDHNLDFKKQDSAGGNQPNGVYNGSDQGATNFSTTPKTLQTGTNIGAETLVKNIGDVFLRRT